MSTDSQIRVLQFLSSTVRAGAEEVALELVRGLDPSRFRSYLVCPQPLLDEFGDDWRVNDAQALALTLNSPKQLGAASKFVNHLRAEKIDVVHAHMIRAAVVAIPLARLAGVPVAIHTCHGREAWRKGWLHRQYWIDRAIFAWADASVAVSESTRGYLVGEKKLNPRNITVIRNGRSLRSFSPDPVRQQRLRAEFGIGPRGLVLGVFGRLEPQKGHRFLLEALPQVLARVPDLKVLFVGDGSLREELQSYAQSHQLIGSLIFTGYRRDWMELMSLTDVVALPSLYEGMPLVPIEAAALGKPVVATSVDGTREVVVDWVTGRLVPPGQPEPLAQALVHIFLHPAERRELGSKAKARAEQMFSLKRQLEETAALYERLLGRVRKHELEEVSA